MDPVRDAIIPLLREAGVQPTAKKLGLHDSNLHAWINGRRDISDESLRKLCKHFGFRVIVTVEKI